MKTLARLIVWNNTFGLNVRYILDNDSDGKALRILRLELAELARLPHIGREELLSHIGTPHSGDDVIDIYLTTVESIEKMDELVDRKYAVALKDNPELPGVPIPNYTAASAIGLSLAALRAAKDKEDENEYESLRKRIFDIISTIYRRFEIIKDDKDFTVHDLELMISGCSENKLRHAILYALPPIVKGLVESLQWYHETLRNA